MTRFLPLLFFLTLAIVLAIALLGQPHRQLVELSGSEMHQKLPILSLHDPKGKRTHLDAKTIAGRVTILNFFASWCTSCAEEHHTLFDIERDDPNAVIVGIAWNDSAWRIDDWLTQHRNPYAALYFDREGKAAIALGMRGLPESFIVDKHGMLRYHLPGPITPDLYASTISPLLARLEAEE